MLLQFDIYYIFFAMCVLNEIFWNSAPFFIICGLITFQCNCQMLEADSKDESREEKCYPNKTVIGKYTFKDSEGNPIEVKYYADENGYRIELKSVKVVDTSTTKERPREILTESAKGNTVTNERLLNKTLTEKNEFLINDPGKELPELLNDDEYQKYKGQENKKRANDLDYEIFLDKETKAPRNAKPKEKYRIYLKKNKRNAAFVKTIPYKLLNITNSE